MRFFSLGLLALDPPVDVDAHGLRHLVVGAGHMVPAARFEVLRGVLARELAELRTLARTVELQLLPFEIGVADAQQQILLDTHYRGDAHRRGGFVLRGKFVDVDQRLVGHGREAVPRFTVIAVLVQRREVDPVPGAELRRHGDRRGAFHNEIGDVRTPEDLHRRPADPNRHEVGFV